MPRRSPYTILLTSEEKQALEREAQKYTSPYYRVVRAKIALYASEGMGNDVIGSRLDLPRQVVSKWRKRFFERRVAGLDDDPRRGRPAVFSPSGRR